MESNLVDFSNLKRKEVTASLTAVYTMPELETEPKFTVHPATQSNKIYFNSTARIQRNNMRVLSAGGAVSATMLDETRELDRQLYPQHIVAGWSGVQDSEGSDVPYSRENAVEFFKVLPGWIFDGLRAFCGNAANFADGVAGLGDTIKN